MRSSGVLQALAGGTYHKSQLTTVDRHELSLTAQRQPTVKRAQLACNAVTVLGGKTADLLLNGS